MISEEGCVSFLVYWIHIREWCIIAEKQANVFLFLYRLVYYVLVQEFLSLDFVRRVASNELRKFHFEDPVDVQVVEDDVKYVSLGTLGIIQKVV